MRNARLALLLLMLAAGVAVGCDRNIGPAVPGEQPRDPDLARIFPDTGGEPASPPTGAPPAPAASAAGGATISGTIALAPEFARVPAGAVLFLIARPAGATGGPPLAVQRMSATGFPLPFEIGPKDVMIPRMQFAGQIVLSARIDSDGNAISRQPGDLHGSSDGTLTPGDTGVTIVIDERL